MDGAIVDGPAVPGADRGRRGDDCRAATRPFGVAAATVTPSHDRCRQGERLPMDHPHGHRQTTTLAAGPAHDQHGRARGARRAEQPDFNPIEASLRLATMLCAAGGRTVSELCPSSPG